ncbi:MAG: DUF721 domain-containing protein [Pseudomonadota bacterium]
MSQDSQQAISHVLQQDSQIIDAVLLKLKQLRELQNILHNYLDEKLAPHCQVANFENNSLCIITNTALWATQLRFQIPNLLTQLNQHVELAGLREIRCKIRPKQHLQQPVVSSPLERLSLETSLVLLETAKTIKHQSLKKIMEKIAQNT